MTTDRSALRGSPAGAGGYRALQPGPGEPHLSRTELDPASTTGAASTTGTTGAAGPREVLLTIAHLSDLHVCDAQSPARVEFLDRWADLDSPVLAELGEVGTYRAQEMLTVQVVEACVRAVNAVTAGPVGGAGIDIVISTGDNIDNAQANELDWYVTLLEGGEVRPDSGDLTRYEGVADDEIDDERFWHPSPETSDLPRTGYGFPTVPGLLDAARRPVRAVGLTRPWLAVHGNHDQLVQGIVTGEGITGDAAIGTSKAIALPDGWGAAEGLAMLADFEGLRPEALSAILQATMRQVTPDSQRRIVGRAEFVAAHFGPAARPSGHGFERDAPHGAAYYRWDHGTVSLLVLDTVNDAGGWQGSLDRAQFAWLAAELTAADAERRYVVLAGHHPLEDLVNPTGTDRVLTEELDALLVEHPCVVLWLAGHTHHTAVTPRGSYWQVVTPSLVDWPQQGRIVELIRDGRGLVVATTMLDHAGSAPWDGSIDTVEALAGLSRELAANDWQWRGTALEDHPRAGPAEERNVLLRLPDPFA